MEENRFTLWVAAANTGGAVLMVGLAVVGLVVLNASGDARLAYAVVGVVNAVAAVVSGLLVRQHLTGGDAVEESVARFGAQLCIVMGVVLPQTMSTVDEPDWRALFLVLGLVLAVAGLATVAVALRPVRIRLGLGSDSTG